MIKQASTTKGSKYIPNKDRAICNAKVATVYKGKRIVQAYKSGEPLKGKIEN